MGLLIVALRDQKNIVWHIFFVIQEIVGKRAHSTDQILQETVTRQAVITHQVIQEAVTRQAVLTHQVIQEAIQVKSSTQQRSFGGSYVAFQV